MDRGPALRAKSEAQWRTMLAAIDSMPEADLRARAEAQWMTTWGMMEVGCAHEYLPQLNWLNLVAAVCNAKTDVQMPQG